MKAHSIVCILLMQLLAFNTQSQNLHSGRPALFSSLPATLDCTAAQLAGLFSAPVNETVQIQFENKVSLSGLVSGNHVKYSNLQTIIIRLTGYNNSLFSLSRQTDRNNNVNFVGRVLNPLYADGFQLIRKANGDYQLKKIDTDKIIVNCSQ
jgi:hypothetical protein